MGATGHAERLARELEELEASPDYSDGGWIPSGSPYEKDARFHSANM